MPLGKLLRQGGKQEVVTSQGNNYRGTYCSTALEAVDAPLSHPRDGGLNRNDEKTIMTFAIGILDFYDIINGMGGWTARDDLEFYWFWHIRTGKIGSRYQPS